MALLALLEISLSHLTSETILSNRSNFTDFDKMRYYCANMQTFAAHYSTRGIWPKLFTALIRVIFQINTHFTHLLGKRCWNCTILRWKKNHFEASISGKTYFKSSFRKWQRRHFRKLLEVARFSFRDVTMAKIMWTTKLWPPPNLRSGSIFISLRKLHSGGQGETKR